MIIGQRVLNTSRSIWRSIKTFHKNAHYFTLLHTFALRKREKRAIMVLAKIRYKQVICNYSLTED